MLWKLNVTIYYTIGFHLQYFYTDTVHLIVFKCAYCVGFVPLSRFMLCVADIFCFSLILKIFLFTKNNTLDFFGSLAGRI